MTQGVQEMDAQKVARILAGKKIDPVPTLAEGGENGRQN